MKLNGNGSVSIPNQLFLGNNVEDVDSQLSTISSVIDDKADKFGELWSQFPYLTPVNNIIKQEIRSLALDEPIEVTNARRLADQILLLSLTRSTKK